MKNLQLICILLIVCSSCNILWDKPPPTVEDQIIIDRARERINKYIQGKRETCFNNIIEEAEIHVDTTITKLIDQYIKDTTYFPPRPDRPLRPDALELDSNFKPEPIFKDSLRTRIKMKRESQNSEKDTFLIMKDSILMKIDTSQKS